MSAGKIASQAGHAYLDAYLQAPVERQAEYKQGHGIKVCLKAKNERQLFKLAELCEEKGIPHQLICDLGYTCFEGRSTITALGVGPIRQSEFPKIKQMELMK